MSIRSWMPLYVADYLADTGHLSRDEHGAYLLLIMHYWRTESLPADDAQLARISKCTAAEWKRIKPTIKAFFDDGWKHRRVEDELKRARDKYEARANAGRKGGKAKAEGNQNPSNATARLYQSQSQAQSSDEDIDVDDARDPVTAMSDALWQAGGDALNRTSTGLMVLSRPLAWLEDGCDLESDVLPAIRAACARASPQSIRSWKYFDQAVADAKARRLAPMPEGRNDERTGTQSRDSRARENHLVGIHEALAERRG